MAPIVQELLPLPDPAECCERLEGLPYRLFLDSAVPGTPLGRYSFVTADPVSTVRSKGVRTEVVDALDAVPDGSDEAGYDTRPASTRIVTGDALEIVRALLAPHASEAIPGLPPFQGGAAG